MEKNKGEGYDFKSEGGMQPIGGSLKPINLIEADLTDENERKQVIGFLKELESDKEITELKEKKRGSRLSVQKKMELFKRDPGGTVITVDGKQISLAQYMKNNKAMNSRDNFDFQTPKGSATPGKRNSPNQDNNSMVNNIKKVK